MAAPQLFINYLKGTHRNWRGASMNRRYLVLESDDWGMVRMPGPDVYQLLLQKGYPVDSNCYSRYDALESNEDLEGLMEVLSSVKDGDGRPAVMTMNNVVANPDFATIAAGGMEQYHYEWFTQTLQRYPLHHRVMDLYKEGRSKNLFCPQFHGREHLHVNNWMEAIKGRDAYTRGVFDYGAFSINKVGNHAPREVYLDAMGCYNEEDVVFVQDAIADGLHIFEQIWGVRSITAIAPCFIWNTDLHTTFYNNGVRMLQSAPVHFDPNAAHSGGYRHRRVYSGKKAAGGLRYLLRNATFEPATNPHINWVDACLAEVNHAFRWRKPAIISTHRLNYIGWLDEQNRSRNLKALQQLLQTVVRLYPDVQFMSSPDLATQFIKS